MSDWVGVAAASMGGFTTYRLDLLAGPRGLPLPQLPDRPHCGVHHGGADAVPFTREHTIRCEHRHVIVPRRTASGGLREYRRQAALVAVVHCLVPPV